MSALWLLFIGLSIFAFGWFVYSNLVAKKVLKLDEEFVTPAHELRDDVDFCPTNKFVLWGHHFTAVAGAAPIVGPAIAVQWGWLPAFLWVVLGTVFFAGIHDMTALWASVRHKGNSIGNVCMTVVGSRVGQLFMIVIFLLLLMVNSAFGVVIAGESVRHPTTIIPAWGAVLIAIAMGQAIYKMKLPLAPVTIIGVVLLYILIPIGANVPVNMPDMLFGLDPMRQWVVILFIYAGIASILPVWMLLQPRDYVNGIQLFIALTLLYVSMILVNPDVVAPTLIPAISDNGEWGRIFPILFITVACGAISGFHGVVSSGTTSKQVDQYKDVRFVGYLGAVGEGSLALATIICCVAGMGLVNGDLNMASWADLFKGGPGNFVSGGGAIIENGLGIPAKYSSTILSLMLVLFAATTMDAGIRLQRYIIQEWGHIYKLPVLTKTSVATMIAVLSSFALCIGGIGEGGKLEVAIWPLFGATNQLLASLTLTVVAVMLMKMNRFKGSLVALCPMTFILTMSLWGAFVKTIDYYGKEKWLLFFLSIIVIIVTIYVALNAFKEIAELLRNRKKQQA